MNDEEKMITIKPLPEDEPKDKKLARKKPGRKLDPNAKSRKKTNEKHIMTDARKQALLKARLARAEKRKKQQEELEKTAKQASDAKSENLPDPNPNKERESDLQDRLGDMENQIKEMNKMMMNMMGAGVFKGSKQTEQTIPQTPTELKHRDITEPEDSYERVENGGVYKQKVAPEQRNMEINPVEPKYNRPDVFFF